MVPLAARLALVALLAAGCGTTVPLSSSGLPADSLGGLAPGSTVPSSAAGGQLSGSTTGGFTPPGSGPQAHGPVPDGSATDGALIGPGDALPPIEIGTYYLNGGNAALAAAGFAGLIIPDSKPVFDAFVKDINAHGGLAGRRIVPVYYEYNTGQDPHTQDAEACATFTQDHHVFLVLGGVNSGAGELLPCLAKHDVPLISAATGGDERFFAQYHRYAYEFGQLNFTAGLRLLVSDLKTRGYLVGVKKVGLVQFPGAVYDHAVEDGLIPALHDVGLKLDDRITTGSNTDNAAIASSSAGAVLKFKTDGVDLVLFMSPGGAPETYFMTAAQQQRYKPKYGIWSADSPTILATTAPHQQLSGSAGVGYLPGLDVASAQDPTAQTPTAKACLQKGKRMGLDESGLANPLIRATCDTVTSLLRAIAGDVQRTRSTSLLEQGFDALATRISPASTFGIRWARGHHDGANGYRQLVFSDDCGCFRYVGPTRLIRTR
jgi:ABC-type branched-subunit amino acid transport system substrate-binding protein